jgi:hypothetical protein
MVLALTKKFKGYTYTCTCISIAGMKTMLIIISPGAIYRKSGNFRVKIFRVKIFRVKKFL